MSKLPGVLPRYAVFLALATWASAARSETIVIDNFDDDTLNEAWVQSNILVTAGNDAVVTFDTVTEVDRLTYSFTTSTTRAVQTALLRNDHTLSNNGDYFQATLNIPFGSPNSVSVFSGLMLDSGSVSPTDRTNMTSILMDATGRILGQQNGTQTFSNASAFTQGTDVILRIQRESDTAVSMWFSADGGETLSRLGGDEHTYEVTGFNSVGFYTGNARSSALGVVHFDDLILVEAEPGTPGDFNGDGNIDGADFVIWQTNFPNNTGTATLDMGDANGDGSVDGADFVVWQTSFPTTASIQPVPEPSSMWLMCIGSIAIAGRGWLSKRRLD